MTFFAQELFAITLYLCSHRQNTLGILVKLIGGYMDGPVNEPSNDYIQIFERQWLHPSQMCILDLLARPKLPSFCKHIFPTELSSLWATVTLRLKWNRGSKSLEGKSIFLGKAAGGYESRSRFTVKLMMPKHWEPPPSHRPLPGPQGALVMGSHGRGFYTICQNQV